MQLRISHKVFLGLLVTSGLSLMVLVVSFKWSLNRGFVAYLNQLEMDRQDTLVSLLQDWYQDHGDWEGLRENGYAWHQLLLTSSGAIERAEPIKHGSRPRPRFRGDERRGPIRNSGRPDRAGEHRPPAGARAAMVGGDHRLTLYDAHQFPVIGPNPWDAKQNKKTITLNGKTVGWLGILPFKEVTENQDLAFLREQTRFIFACLGALVILSVLVAIMLARHLNRPIADLARASRQMTRGKFDVRVTPQTKDEIGQLAHDFNHMARSLEDNRNSRRRWFADISHELRTPLTILKGELDAVDDGIRELNQQTQASFRQEVDRLGKMIDDLYELSLSDLGALDYKMAPLNLVDVLHQCLEAFLPRAKEKEITVETHGLDGHLEISADGNRLSQLINNLLENSLRYTNSPGRIQCTVTPSPEWVEMVIEDTAPGVSVADCQNLFQRLYRIDKSRSRKHGGAGLGLAICKNIAEAHGGNIFAEPSSIGGLKINVRLRR